MNTVIHPVTPPKKVFDGVVLDSRNTIAQLLKSKRLFDMNAVAKITTYDVRYLRRLCAAKKVDCYKFLGRYFMTPAQIGDLLVLSPAARKREKIIGPYK